jgi:hypothetical protein
VIAVVAGVIVAALLDAGGSGHAPTSTAAAPSTAGTTTRAVPSLDDRLAQLPMAAPGDLSGRLQIVDDHCDFRWIDLARMTTRPSPLASQSCRRHSVIFEGQSPDTTRISDPSGRLLASLHVPSGWWVFDATRTDAILCGPKGARVVRFAGGRSSLPACPLMRIGERLVFASPGGRSLVDASGRVIVALRHSTAGANVYTLSAGVLVVQHGNGRADLYRGGSFLASVGPAGHFGRECSVTSASGDGRVVLWSCGNDGVLAVTARDGVTRTVRNELASFEAVLSVDGRYLLIVRRDGGGPVSQTVVLDARTLAPLYRVPLPDGYTVTVAAP